MVLIMNKNDIRLICLTIVIILGLFIFIYITKEKGSVAEVYYEDDLILSVPLDIDSEYTVEGALGDVVLEVKDGKIRVKSENSPKNICSKEGYIGDSSRTLICLPNKIIIKIVGGAVIDGVVY